MALREIVVDHVWWVVFPAPASGASAALPERAEAGWLYARSLSDLRRIARLPADWQDWTDARLAGAIRAAMPQLPLS